MRLGFVGLVFLIWSTGAALATPGQDLVTASLREQGFEVQLVHWTLLGRIRIIAESEFVRREIVINPNTGEILRDYSQILLAVQSADGRTPDNNSAPSTTRTMSDLDASAMSALQEMGTGVPARLLTEPVQE